MKLLSQQQEQHSQELDKRQSIARQQYHDVLQQYKMQIAVCSGTCIHIPVPICNAWCVIGSVLTEGIKYQVLDPYLKLRVSPPAGTFFENLLHVSYFSVGTRTVDRG